MRTFEESYDKIRRHDFPEFSLVTKPRCKELWNTVESVKNLKGNFIEIGVWRGGTAALILQQIINLNLSDKLFLCDTFKGVVKAGKEDLYYKNGEHSDCSTFYIDQLFSLYFKFSKDKYSILEGIFPEETGKYIENEKFKFIHLDVDVYQSTKDSFDYLLPKLVKDGIIIIDDYEWKNCTGITKFVNELIEQKRNDIEIYNGIAPYHAIIRKIK